MSSFNLLHISPTAVEEAEEAAAAATATAEAEKKKLEKKLKQRIYELE